MAEPTIPPKPTPADLLAQADALMRKNRAPAEEDLPVLDMEVYVAEAPSRAKLAAAVEGKAQDWDEVCETVYSRVMQQMDLYTEFGLKERIARDMRPRLHSWAERFSREFSEEIAMNVRRYVAQAVDEEVSRIRAEKK
jgi:hypothetical protein